MHMKGHLLVFLVLAVLTSGILAQVRGKHRGLFVAGCNLAHGVNWMLQLDATGNPATLRTGGGNPAAPWRSWGNVYGMTMDADNRTVIVPGILGSSLNPLVFTYLRYDPMNKAVVGTIWQGISDASNLTSWSNITLNSDGDVVTIDNARMPDVFAEYDVFSSTWRHGTLPVHPGWHGIGIGAGVGGCEWDEFRGGIHHATWNSSLVVPGFLFHTSHDYSATRTLSRVQTPSNITLRFGGTLLDDSDWASSGYDQINTTRSSFFLRSKGGGGPWQMVNLNAGTVAWDVTHEKYSAPGQGLWVANWFPRGVHHIDANTNTVTVVHTGTAASMPGDAYEVLPLYDRDLGSRRTGRATWSLFVNPGAGSHAGKNFVVVASLAPPRPGLKLPDGRDLFIGFDSLTALSSAGSIPPFLVGNIGTLDVQGVGMGRIDLTLLGRGANGTVIHFCGVILDSAAPNGVAWVLDPHAFVIDVMP